VAVETRRRLPPEIFELPVEKLRAGYYADAYFNHARATLLQDERRPRVVMQVFQKQAAYLGGMDEALAILRLGVDDWDELTVHALHDGDRWSRGRPSSPSRATTRSSRTSRPRISACSPAAHS
jgi:hypothetical protein